MSSASVLNLEHVANRSIVPCKVCKKKPWLVNEGYDYNVSNQIVILCGCGKSETVDLNPLYRRSEAIARGAAEAIYQWNEKNRMILEWFPDRAIPSAKQLSEWDSSNTLRPYKEKPRSSTSLI